MENWDRKIIAVKEQMLITCKKGKKLIGKSITKN